MWMPNVNRFTPRKHQALMAALREEIRTGRLGPGDRLPAQRDLSAAIGVAVGTIARVYRDAGAEGLIRSTVGRGSYVARQADEL
ncbi:MAG: GntR family transcriptional regulator, partial [Dechloromonas sp.]